MKRIIKNYQKEQENLFINSNYHLIILVYYVKNNTGDGNCYYR